jgi:hypothetical protein
MQRCSETIGLIAGALAKAQTELANPEKSLTATIRSPSQGKVTAASATPLCPARCCRHCILPIHADFACAWCFESRCRDGR